MGRKTTLWTLQSKFHTRKLEREISDSSSKQSYKDSVKARIDKIRKNSRCRFFSDREKIIYYIISECRRFVQREYKTRWAK